MLGNGNRKNFIPFFSLTLLFVLVLLFGIFTNFFNEEEEHPDREMDEEDNGFFENITYQKSIFYDDEPLAVEVEIRNPEEEPKELWFGYRLMNPIGDWTELPVEKVVLSPSDTTTLSLSSPQDDINLQENVSGAYTVVFSLWDHAPDSYNSQPLTDIEIPDAFRYHHGIETFDSLNEEIWYSRRGTLGRSQLEPENVQLNEDQLHITIPKATLQGGELQTIEKHHYGSYEISMQLPDAPSSLTGFFLYKAPDYSHEIDIEIFNKSTTEVLFTTYYDGSIHHEAVYPLDFDPTEGFNRYRFDYYPEEVAFYINDQLMQRWEDGFSKEPMHLFVNTWFPQWLEGEPVSEDKVLKIEWIRY